MQLADLADQAQACFEDEGCYAISVRASATLDAESLVRDVRREDSRQFQQDRMKVSTAGAIRGVGFHVTRDGLSPTHYNVWLDECPTENNWRQLIGVFSETRDAPPKEDRNESTED
jgi:hypothetical protein